MDLGCKRSRSLSVIDTLRRSHYGLQPHLYADDTQVYGHTIPIPSMAVHLQDKFPLVSTAWRSGCGQTAYKSMRPRLSFRGVGRAVDGMRFRRPRFVLALMLLVLHHRPRLNDLP